MKIIALTILIILLFCRIKNTPAMLSKKLYMNKIQKSIDKNKESLKNMDEEPRVGKSNSTYIRLDIRNIIRYFLHSFRNKTWYNIYVSSFCFASIYLFL